MAESSALRRTLGTATLTAHGVGVIVGAGVFVLIGEVAAHAGRATWLAFIAAALAALPTGLSYAELASRYPHSAGEAVFAERAFSRPSVSFLVGFVVVASGVMSTAAVSRGFAGFARYAPIVLGTDAIPPLAAIIGFVAVLSLINDRGIRAATWTNVVFTGVSVAALVAVGVAGIPHWGAVPSSPAEAPFAATALLPATALAFYAFIGFEDMCNVAEETRDPSRTIPKAILLALAISTAVYVLVAYTAVSAVSPAELAAHPAPTALVSERVIPALSGRWLAFVAVLAVANTALFNLIMTSRVLFGMANNGWLPASLARVSERTRTPRVGVAAAFVLVVAFASTGALAVLAEATNVIILLAFAAVNLSLLVIRHRRVPADPEAGRSFVVPRAVPVLGLTINAFLLAQLSAGPYLRAGVLIAAGVAAHLAVRRRSHG